MQNTTYPIVVENVSKWYGDFQAVKDLSFHVQSGEIFALLGPNGAGKSTTIRMILDIIRIDVGSIQVLGGKMTDSTKNRVGYLPEERGLYKSVKVLEMMMYLGQLKGMSRNDARQRAMELLEKLELAAHAKSKVEELSKGMQQKVQFAVTVQHRPDIIIVDEPFSGLDPVNRIVIKDLLEEFKQQGGAVIMSTHQMNQIEEMAERMLMIDRGEQKLYGRVDDIRQEYAVHAIVVEGQGQWDALPGVTKVEAQNGRGSMLLHLADDATSDAVLAAIAQSPNYRIERFERAVPSLDEIFIRVAGEKANA
jgi:ABC-2 type transport system ATP-binding protein